VITSSRPSRKLSRYKPICLPCHPLVSTILWKAIAIAEKDDMHGYMAIMMSLPLIYGVSKKRWENTIYAILEKELIVGKCTSCKSLDLSRQTST